MINEVRNKWNEFPELKSCHHFLYDDLYRNGKNFVLFMGINPGEPKKDWVQFPEGLCEESRYINFRKDNNSLSKSSKRWFGIIEKMVPDFFGVIQSELFFWSSPDIKTLNNRIPDWKNSKILDFCTKANIWLIKNYNIDLVIVTSVSDIDLFCKKYKLKLIEKFNSKFNSRRLVEKYISDIGTTWLFCLHPTGTLGLTKDAREEIIEIINKQCKAIII